VGIYVGCLSVDGSAAEVFRRFCSAFKAEGWKALEELGAVGGGLVGGLCSLFVLQGLGLRVLHAIHVAPLGLANDSAA